MSSKTSMSESGDDPEEHEDGYKSSGAEQPRKKLFSVVNLDGMAKNLQILCTVWKEKENTVEVLVERRVTAILSDRHTPDDANEFGLA